MSSETAPRYETRVAFNERLIARLASKGYPDRVISKIMMPLLTGAVSANTYKAQVVMRQLCETEQDRHSFRLHYLGTD